MRAPRSPVLLLLLASCEPPAQSDADWTPVGTTAPAPGSVARNAEPLDPVPATGEFRCGPLVRIEADDLGPGDAFGSSISISGDTVLVGAPNHDALGEQSGAAYVFVRSPSGWTQQAKLLAPDGAALMEFGTSVALDGDTALVGAPGAGDGSSLPGSAYVFVRSAGAWSLQVQFTGGDESSEFGHSVALERDTALVGAPFEGSVQSGRAHVFARSGEAWNDEVTLEPPPLDGGWFGTAVALCENQALISLGPGGGPEYQPVAHMFARSASGWALLATLLPPADAILLEKADFFGSDVDVAGSTAIVGNPGDPGVAYVYERTPLTWLRTTTLVPGDADTTSGTHHEGFGASVGLGGDLAVVGAPGADGVVVDSGAMFLFSRAPGVWTKVAKMFPADGMDKELFGNSMSIEGSRVAIGAFGRNEAAGAAYVVACATRAPIGLECPPPLTLECDSPGGVRGDSPSIGTWRTQAVVTGGCPEVMVVDDAPEVLPASCEAEPQPVTVTFSASDACGQTATCTSTVAVLDRIAPSLDVSLQQTCLWSPNHDFVDVAWYAATDACDTMPAASLLACSDEAPASERGAGGPAHCPDARIYDGAIQLRAERAGSSGSDNGRVYTRVAATAQDACGNAVSRDLPSGTTPGCPGVVCVAHDQDPDQAGDGLCAAVEDLASWDATSCSPEAACP